MGLLRSIDQPEADEVPDQGELVAQLRQAVVSHEQIGQAVGVLIAAYRIPPEQAFAILRSASQTCEHQVEPACPEPGRVRGRAATLRRNRP
jgi:hypothetical protein